MPVARHVEPESQAPEAPVARVAAGDRAVGRLLRAGVEAPVLLPDPGVDGEKVVPAQDTQEPLGCIGPEAVLEEDRFAYLLGRDPRILPPGKIELPRGHAARTAPQ